MNAAGGDFDCLEDWPHSRGRCMFDGGIDRGSRPVARIGVVVSSPPCMGAWIMPDDDQTKWQIAQLLAQSLKNACQLIQG